MTKKISQREFTAALAAAKHPPATKHPHANRPVMAVSVDMRLTTDDLAKLDAEQVQAVFEGVGKLAAMGAAR